MVKNMEMKLRGIKAITSTSFLFILRLLLGKSGRVWLDFDKGIVHFKVRHFQPARLNFRYYFFFLSNSPPNIDLDSPLRCCTFNWPRTECQPMYSLCHWLSMLRRPESFISPR
jgi:hypothetical protein